MSLNEIKQSIKQKLAAEFEAIELNSMLSMLIEHITGWNQVQQVVNKDTPITEAQLADFEIHANELLKGKPIQYIIGKSWFMGNEFIVNENVLIPRPETEELVEWIVEYASIVDRPLKIIDLGTGSGCIPITLKNALPNCTITGIDISTEALAVAKLNATKLNAAVEWIPQDILMSASLPDSYDIIVSNPPYIPAREKTEMQAQVKDHEPSIALFVEDEDPLIFYRIIARLGKQSLTTNGQLFFEIHYDQGEALLEMLNEMNYHAELRQDMYGKDRMIRASLKH